MKRCGVSSSSSNHPAAGKAGLALVFAIEHHCPGLPEPGRSARSSLKFFLTPVLILLMAGMVSAATSEEELRFLQAVRLAYSTTNIDNILSLHCWDGVPALQRGAKPGLVERGIKEERKVQSVDYVVSPQVNHSMLYTNNGIAMTNIPQTSNQLSGYGFNLNLDLTPAGRWSSKSAKRKGD